MARPGISTKNDEKKKNPGRDSGSPRKTEKKYPPKVRKMVIFGILGIFFRYFRGKFWESRILGRGVFFRHFSWKFRVGPSRDFVEGRGVLRYMTYMCKIMNVLEGSFRKVQQDDLFKRQASGERTSCQSPCCSHVLLPNLDQRRYAAESSKPPNLKP